MRYRADAPSKPGYGIPILFTNCTEENDLSFMSSASHQSRESFKNQPSITSSPYLFPDALVITIQGTFFPLPLLYLGSLHQKL